MSAEKKTNLLDVIIISLAIGLIVIGFSETLKYGFMNSYWIFMFAIGLLGLYQYRKKYKK